MVIEYGNHTLLLGHIKVSYHDIFTVLYVRALFYLCMVEDGGPG